MKVLQAKATPSSNAGSLQKRKLHRKKALAWLRCADNALRSGASFGLEEFAITEEVMKLDPLTWPQLVICADQGSDGLAAFNWLAQTQRFNGEFIGDPAHGMANDLKLALQRCGVWKHTLLMTAMLNVPHGPWKEQRFFQKLSEAHQEYLSSANAETCPLFNHYYPALLKDRGLEGDIGDDTLPQKVWDMLRESWCMWTKGSKVGTSRWFSVGDAAKAFDSEWHSKLLSISFMMWEEGDLHDLTWNKSKVLAPSATAGLPAGEERRTNTQAQNDVQLSRQACKNGLKFTYLCLTQPEMQYTQRIIECISKEMRLHHGIQMVAVRSSEEAYAWLSGQVSGGFWTHLNNIAKVMDDVTAHEYCGCGDPSRNAGCDLPDSHPLMRDQFKMAELMGDLVLNALKARINRWMPLTSGWPSRSILLASNLNVELKEKALKDLKHDYECFQKLGGTRGAFAQKVFDRSAFHLMSEKQLIAIMQGHEWTLAPPVLEWLEQKYRTVGQSAVVERAFQQLRGAEKRSVNGSIGNHGKYDVLVTSQRLQDEHRYTSLPVDRGVVPRGESCRLPDQCFSAKKSSSSNAEFFPMQEIVGYNSNPKWYSPGAAHVSQRHADLYLVREFAARDQLCDMKNSWLNTLVNAPRLLLRKKSWPGDRWVFVLGESYGSVVFTWPAETRRLNDTVVVLCMDTSLCAHDLAQALEPLVIADITEWEGKTFTWLPGWVQQKRYGNSVGGMCALPQTEGPFGLIVLAAKDAFYKMPMPAFAGTGEGHDSSVRAASWARHRPSRDQDGAPCARRRSARRGLDRHPAEAGAACVCG